MDALAFSVKALEIFGLMLTTAVRGVFVPVSFCNQIGSLN